MYGFIFHIQHSKVHNNVVRNPCRSNSGLGNPFSPSETVDLETHELLQMVSEEDHYGKRKQGILKALVRCRLPRLLWGISLEMLMALRPRLINAMVSSVHLRVPPSVKKASFQFWPISFPTHFTTRLVLVSLGDEADLLLNASPIPSIVLIC